ncbi:uracil DNA N-glycosylase Thp1 [Coemansia guatemalensis]|uniref:Uracil DNA N-glycosylase Thp1 n=1 Tax=Coemansia guatemalensis TaxID=2761395 RepID=A0A9W8HR57_9FUNG|nr:uracil DNA N-glycosylase Thp1 [Coemansia guatemalensis]
MPKTIKRLSPPVNGTRAGARSKTRSLTEQRQRPAKTPHDLSQLKPIPETLRPGLDIIFVGINPGIMSGLKQLHFGNPRNFFWKGLFQSSLIPRPISPEEGHLLWDEWNMTIVNLVQRTTSSTSDLTRQEMRDAVPELCRKISANPPKILCFVGKGIYEAFVDAKRSTLGLQDDVYDLRCAPPSEPHPPLCSLEQCVAEPAKEQHRPAPLLSGDHRPAFAHIFVMPSTSGRTAAYQNPEKLLYFKQLKYIRDCVTGAEGNRVIDREHLQEIGPTTTSKYFSAKNNTKRE